MRVGSYVGTQFFYESIFKVLVRDAMFLKKLSTLKRKGTEKLCTKLYEDAQMKRHKANKNEKRVVVNN